VKTILLLLWLAFIGLVAWGGDKAIRERLQKTIAQARGQA
jgi:hypothetical protein